MREDILSGNYVDPMELDEFALTRVSDFGNDVETLFEPLNESVVKYLKKRKELQQEDFDEESIKDQYPAKRKYRPVKGIKEPWTDDQSLIWPDYEAEAFENFLASIRGRPKSNTGYENKALNRRMTQIYGNRANKCIDDNLFQ